MRRALVWMVGLAALGFAGTASATVTVLGSTGAADCSRAAKSGRFDDGAYMLCSNAISLDVMSRRDLAGTYVNRATMSLLRQDWAAARRDLDAAAGVDGSLGEIHVNRGVAYLGLRQYREALAEFDTGLTRAVEEPQKAYYDRGMARELTDDVTGAYYDYKKAAELAPKWEEPRAALTRFTVRVKN